MQLTLMKGKIHRATVTGADLHYEGSIGIDRALMNAAGFLKNEREGTYQAAHGTGFNRTAGTYCRRILRREHAFESIGYFERAGTEAARHSTFRS